MIREKPKILTYLAFLAAAMYGCVFPHSGSQQSVSTAASELDTISEPECNKITFTAFDYGEKNMPDIFTVCPDGSGLRRLTEDPAADISPVWSPDGKQIAFASNRSDQYQIYLMQADGSGLMQLTSEWENDDPLWHPDGKRLAFRSTDSQGLWWWQMLDLNTNEFSLLTEPSPDHFFRKIAWSPDGTEIAYMSLAEQSNRNDGSSQIHVSNTDGTGDRVLTNDIQANILPVWSPDGKQIAFLSERDGNYNIYAIHVMNFDGSDVQRVCDPIYTERADYAWSADGNSIAVGDVSTGEIQIINLQNGEIKSLSIPSFGENVVMFNPDWQHRQ